jgi:hypothetical protein
LNYLQRGGRWDFVLSGVAAGLAWLTRSANLVLGPFFALLVLIEIVPLVRARATTLRAELRRWVPIGLAWTGIGLAVFVLLWPAMWVSAVNTIQRMVNGGLDLATDPHARQIFFAGNVTTEDPGAQFYPVVFLWRTSPVILLGLLFAMAACFLPASLGRVFPRRTVAYLALFAVVYALILTVGEKKLDRYILPSQAALNLIAAAGWVAAGRWVSAQIRSTGVTWITRLALPAILALAVALQGASAASAYPYYLDYFNPLLGGSRGAREAMMVGWGEGMDLAAKELLALPNPEEIRVTVGPWDTSFSYFFPGRTMKANYTDSPDAVRLWASTDYRIITFPEVQRELIPAPLLAHYRAMEPIATIQLDDEEYAWIYDNRSTPVPQYYVDAGLPIFDWNESARLAAIWLPKEPVAPGEDVRSALYLQKLASTERRLKVDVRLVDPQGRTVAQETDNFSPPKEQLGIWAEVQHLAVPVDAPAGTYRIVATVRDRDTSDPVAGVRVATGEPVPVEWTVGTVEIASSS